MNVHRPIAILRRVVVVTALLYVAFLGAVTAVIPHLELFDIVMAKMPRPLGKLIPMRQLFNIVRAGKLKPGDPAPDFNLPTTDRKDYVRLSSFRGQKPVVLVFGSYT